MRPEPIKETDLDIENILSELKKEEPNLTTNSAKVKKAINHLETYSNIDRPCNYIPITKVMNHFYCSPTDQIWLRQQNGSCPESDKLFSEFAKKAQADELTSEIL